MQIRLQLHHYILFGFFACTLAATGSLSGSPLETSVITLKKGELEVGILPEVGGRIVQLQFEDGPNLIKSDPALWNESKETRPSPTDSPVWKEYGGHIIWLVPQSRWWPEQSVFPEMRERNWPPDPYWIYAPYEIIEQTPDRILLHGPISPITGTQLTKSVRLLGGGRVSVEATVTNRSESTQTWGIWMNTRFDSHTPSYMPLPNKENPPYEFISPDSATGERALPYREIDGFFHFRNDLPIPEGLDYRANKVSATPARGWIAAFPPDTVFIKQASTEGAASVHPEHRFAEIYNKVPASLDDWGILELELIGPSVKLAPGESTSFKETWLILPYNRANHADAHIDYLQSVVSPLMEQGSDDTAPSF